MNLGLRPFQILLFAAFGVLGIGSFLIFLIWEPPVDPGEMQFGDQVVIWGTVSSASVNQAIRAAADSNKAFNVVSYRQLDPRTFEDELVDAIAEGRSPDAVLIPHTELVLLRTKLFPVAYSEQTWTQRSYRETFVDGAEIFAFPEGIYAFPTMVDPLVMYWNRDLLSSNGYVNPPTTWESVVSNYVPTLVERDFNRNITTSAVALGEYSNIRNAFAILSALTMQGGSRLVSPDSNRYSVQLSQSFNSSVDDPFRTAVDFYTSFARVNNPLYSWNRAQNEDRNEFAAGDLAIYFGMGSEYSDIAALNPNLNFDIADLPQGAGSTAKRTYGTFYGYAILNASPNKSGAYAAISTLITEQLSAQVAGASDMAPVIRSSVAAGSLDPVDQVRYRSAIITRGWLSPELSQTEAIFKEMIESILANRLRIDNAVQDAISRLSRVY